MITKYSYQKAYAEASEELHEQTFIPLIIECLQKKREEEAAERPPGRSLYISDVGKCHRQIALSIKETEETNPTSPDALLNMHFGTVMEKDIAELLKKYSDLKIFEQTGSVIKKNGQEIRGRSDFEIIMSSKDGLELIELKTISMEAATWMLRKKEYAKDEHARQLNLYMHNLGYKAGRLVYLLRSATKGARIGWEVTVKYNEEQARKDIEELVLLGSKVESEEEVPIPSEYTDPSKFPCGWCKYQDYCWSNK